MFNLKPKKKDQSQMVKKRVLLTISPKSVKKTISQSIKPISPPTPILVYATCANKLLGWWELPHLVSTCLSSVIWPSLPHHIVFSSTML